MGGVGCLGEGGLCAELGSRAFGPGFEMGCTDDLWVCSDIRI